MTKVLKVRQENCKLKNLHFFSSNLPTFFPKLLISRFIHDIYRMYIFPFSQTFQKLQNLFQILQMLSKQFDLNYSKSAFRCYLFSMNTLLKSLDANCTKYIQVLYHERKKSIPISKGQLISERTFCVSKSPKKTN